MKPGLLNIQPEVAEALRGGRPVVALESTLIAHGLPWPLNHETASLAEEAIRAEGGVPATIVVWEGRPTVGLTAAQLQSLARGGELVLKASRRDLATAVAQGRTAATTVAATTYLAHQAGIRMFATGGIGGVHRGVEQTGDISGDLPELARTPVAVVCSGAKNILDIPRTLEYLETFGVPVISYGTEDFPAFYLRSSGEHAPARADTPEEAGLMLAAHWSMDGAGVVLAQPVPAEAALDPAEWAKALREAERAAAAQKIRGKAVTPFLLSRVAEITEGRTLHANRELVVANARLAARVARVLCQLCQRRNAQRPS